MNNQLYEQDFNLWRETIIEQIKKQHFHDVDWEHLILELEDMGKSEKRSFLLQYLHLAQSIEIIYFPRY